MIRALERILKSENLLTEDDRLVVGVSGGADSVALLHLMHELNHQCGWRLHLHVAHLNHQLRGRDADDDEAFVKELAERLSLPCTTDRRDVATLAAQSLETLEETGRKERYAFFERVCLKADANIVAVAHHADDQAETVLHRILRGTGLRGLAGIPRERPLQPGSGVRLIRPLLQLGREELRDFLKQRNLIFRQDRSNEIAEPTRNWIRIHLLPRLRAEMNPKVDAALIRLARQAADLKSSTDDLVARTLESIITKQTDVRLTLHADALAQKSRFLQAAIISHVCRVMGVREQKLSATHISEILSLLSGTRKPSFVPMPGGWRVYRQGHELVLSRESSGLLIPPRPPPIPLTVPGETTLPALGISILTQLMHVTSGQSALGSINNDHCFQEVDFDTLHPPLYVRTRLPGDRFHPLGAPGAKRLSEFFIDRKIPRENRDRIPMIVDARGPVWIVGQRIDDRVKLTGQTQRVLRWEVRMCKP